MKWKSHREVTKVIADDLGLDTKKMLKGSVYPDRVGMKKQGKDVYIEGVAMSYPHHKQTNYRIKKMVLRLRKKVLNGEKIDSFTLGCLCHLIEDRVVFPHAHRKFEEFERDVAKYKIKNEWREEHIPVKDGAILKELRKILKLDNPNDPESALKESYQETLLILKSLLLNPPYLPKSFQPLYGNCKKHLKTRKKLRYAYWLLTYLNPLAPLNAIIDREAIANRNIVKRYGFVKRGAIWKGVFSIIAFLIGWGIFVFLQLLPHHEVTQQLPPWWSFWCLLPTISQILTIWVKIPKELMRNLEWFNFEK